MGSVRRRVVSRAAVPGRIPALAIVGALALTVLACSDKATAPADKPRSEPVKIETGDKALGQACTAPVECATGLACEARRCVYPGPCGGTVVTEADGVVSMERLRVRYDDRFRVVLEEHIAFDRGQESRFERRTTTWIDDQHAELRVEYSDGKGYSERSEYDARGRVTRTTTDFDEGPRDLTSVAKWAESSACERPPRLEHLAPGTGALESWTEPVCDEQGRLVSTTEFKAGPDGNVVVARKTYERSPDGRKLVITRSSGANDELTFDGNGNVLTRRETSPKGDFITTETYEYGCWSFSDGKLSGAPPKAWTPLEPGAFVTSLHGQWRQSGTDTEVSFEPGKATVPGHGTQPMSVLAETPTTADLQLGDGAWLEARALEGGTLSLVILEGSGSAAPVLRLTRFDPSAVPTPAVPRAKLLDPTAATDEAPAVFEVQLKTTKGDVVIEVHREWAPIGTDRFYNLVKLGFYEDIAFFRAIDGFMVQFGIHGTPDVATAWKDASIEDDPRGRSNERGTISFASRGPNTRTTQVFINYRDNTSLDGMGFVPFGKVIEGMDVIDSLHTGYGEGAPRGKGPNQGLIHRRGNEYLRDEFPELDYLERATLSGG